MNDPKDDQSEYDYDETNEDKKSTASSTTDATTEYIKHEYTQKGDIGKDVVLTCKGIFGADSIVIWYNGTKIIQSGKQNFEKRVKMSQKDGALTIESVDVYDDGVFRCRTFNNDKDRYETIVQLEVSGPPKEITIGHNLNQENIDGKDLIYRANEKDLRFKCNVLRARPAAKFSWMHDGNVIQESKDHDIQIDGNLLIIKTLHARHAGEYTCEASNEHGTIKAHFKIDAQCEFLTIFFF